MENKKGSSILEMVVAIGVLGLTLTGVVALMINLLSMKGKGYDRKKAVRLAETVMERLVETKGVGSSEFWKLTDESSQTLTGFDGYTYTIDFENITGSTAFPGCGVGVTDCTNVTVRVDWLGGSGQTVSQYRFFSRRAN